jgi:hypothetical protein
MINSGFCSTPHDDAGFDQWASEAVADFRFDPVLCTEARSTRRSLERKKGHLRWQEAQV